MNVDKRETNSGYEIKLKASFADGVGVALAENPRAVQPFVCWQFTERDGKPDYYWGRYHTDEQKALADVIKRICQHGSELSVGNTNPLAATEISIEGNYNMIDGIINNEMPKEEKPSVINQLKQDNVKPFVQKENFDKATNIDREY